MYCQSNKASPQLDLINDILFLQSVCSFSISLRTCLGSFTNTSCLSVLRPDHVILLNIS
ncbi:Chloroplast envelope membrane [Gossypium arboreum]|uniref:Chloroplast envelope membrane n=1 Tax=Gossypium arboreum TaxID=29729 RepID=A0A0B0NXU0_GOSAR|nr:Chloroplast envelope membrane [Gossypium arboreum]